MESQCKKCANYSLFKMITSKWTNESWTVSWFDQDQVLIQGPNGKECYIDGGDFEWALAALVAAYRKGQQSESARRD